MKWFKKKNQRDYKNLVVQLPEQKLAEIGEQLRLTRQQQALSVDEVAAKTMIQRRLLQAIEQGKLEELPEPIYIQIFIKRYGDLLGLNGSELANTFPLGDRQLLSGVKPLWTRLPMFQLSAIHLYLLYIFVIMCAVNILSQMLNHSMLQASSSHQEELELQRRSSISKLQNFKPVSTDKKSSNSVRIDITLKAAAKVQVVADGKTQFEGILPPGTHRTWIAQKQLTLRTNNAGGVVVTFNQDKPKPLGEIGKQQQVTFAANSRQ